MHPIRVPRFRLIVLALVCAALPLLATEPLRPGARLDALTVGTATYRDVHLRSINARTVIFTHAGGMASLKLADLPPDLQSRLGYDPASAESSPPPNPSATSAVPRPRPLTLARAPATPFEQLLQRFGQPAELARDVDLRPKYFELELHVKNQGRRPSCAVFAIVSALELQHAQLTGSAQKFSEEYLIWATRQTTARVPLPLADENADYNDADEGFALEEVVSALRTFGIPLQSAMPNTIARAMDAIPAPPPDLVAAAKNQRRVFIHAIPGRDNATRINNLVHALNAGLPVPVGLAWPNFRSLRTGYLGAQTPLPGVGHAVTLVGYKSPTGKFEDTIFVFKNSWGVAWGQGGYGWVTFDYLRRHLGTAALLEVQP